MATPEQVPPQNVAELTPQQIADQIAAQQTGGEPPQLQREYVIETSTGAVFRGKTQQEVIDAMKKSVEHGSETIKQQKDELERYRALEQQLMSQQVQQQTPDPFNPQRYYESWAQDPMAAEVALIDRALQQRYGISLDDFAQQVQHSYRFTQQVEPEVTARSWMAQSNFPTSNPEEMEKASKAIEQVWNEYYPNDYNITPQRLDQMHAVALMRGLYQPERPATTGQVVEQQLQPANQMPTLNTGATGGTGQQQEVNHMTPEQIRAFIDQQFR